MAGVDENNPGVMGTENPLGGFRGGTGKFPVAMTGHNRRALSSINRNIVGVPPYHCAVNKKGTLGSNADICEKKTTVPVHRPITRKFAAQLATNQQAKPQESKNPLMLEDDCIVIDVDEYKTTTDVPMFVQHTEAMLEEIYRMEVEMEDVAEELVTDIDSVDSKDPLEVVEYIDELYQFYKRSEVTGCVAPTYMSQQFDINERMRGILIDWLIEVHYKFELMDETLYLTVNLTDRFLAIQPMVRKKLQLVGVTAMLLACKYEEVSVPVVDDLILISDKAYTRKEILEMEKLMVNTLQFNMSVPTPYVFMRRFLKAAQADKKLELLSFFMVELCLVEYDTLRFPPSLLAAAAIYTAQCTLSGSRQWSKTNEWYSNYSEGELLECSRMMAVFHQNAACGKVTGVHRKYSTSKFGYAAKTHPANFLLEKD